MTLLHLEYLKVGHCNHWACMAVRDEACKSREFPSYCALIQHPGFGYLLFDTGYADHFNHATDQLPEKLYRLALPYSLPTSETLIAQLAQRGIAPTEIGAIVISHYHGDHIAGLKDFPNAHFFASKADTEHLATLSRWRATREGILPGLLPDDFPGRLTLTDSLQNQSLPSWMRPFTEAKDLLGDGSLLLIQLPGHSPGQLGLFLPNTSTGPALLCADACWSLPACKRGALPARLVSLFTHNWGQYKDNFYQLQALALREPSVAILPSHCPTAFDQFQRRAGQ